MLACMWVCEGTTVKVWVCVRVCALVCVTNVTLVCAFHSGGVCLCDREKKGTERERRSLM